MPRFKTTNNIFKDRQEFMHSIEEVPPLLYWDSSRDLQIEDVDIWEVITEMSGLKGLYASWLPYAEFYMIVNGGNIDSTYYGEGSDKHAAKRCEELKIPYPKK